MVAEASRFYLARLTAVTALGGFLFGYDTAIVSGAVRFVATRFALDAASTGWFVSCALVGCIVGVAYTGVLRDRFGTKAMLVAAAALFTASGLGCAIAADFAQLVLFRFVGGLGIGMASMLCPLYIAEIAPPARRGTLVACYQVAITVGIVVAYLANAVLLDVAQHGVGGGAAARLVFQDEPWRAMLGSGAAPALLFLALLPAVPESPRWLAQRGREDEARATIARIAGDAAATTELAEIRATLATENRGRAALFGDYRVPALLGIALALLQQLSGINAVIYYGPMILERTGLDAGGAFGGQVAIGLVNVAGTFVALFTIDRLGRRPLLLWGAAGSLLSLLAMAALFGAGGGHGTALLVATMAFIACFSLSYGPVTWVLLSEIYPTRIRGVALSTATIALWLGTALVGQATPWMLDTITPAGTFLFFAACTLPTIWLAARVIPETRGRSLEEIERGWAEAA